MRCRDARFRRVCGVTSAAGFVVFILFWCPDVHLQFEICNSPSVRREDVQVCTVWRSFIEFAVSRFAVSVCGICECSFAEFREQHVKRRN